MSSAEITSYLGGLSEEKRSTLQALRTMILSIIPDAEECISYQLPAFRLGGFVVAGFGAYKNHLSYFPHSGSAFDQMGDELAGYETSRGALRFPISEPLPRALVERLLVVRIAEAPTKGRPHHHRQAKPNA